MSETSEKSFSFAFDEDATDPGSATPGPVIAPDSDDEATDAQDSSFLIDSLLAKLAADGRITLTGSGNVSKVLVCLPELVAPPPGWTRSGAPVGGSPDQTTPWTPTSFDDFVVLFRAAFSVPNLPTAKDIALAVIDELEAHEYASRSPETSDVSGAGSRHSCQSETTPYMKLSSLWYSGEMKEVRVLYFDSEIVVKVCPKESRKSSHLSKHSFRKNTGMWVKDAFRAMALDISSRQAREIERLSTSEQDLMVRFIVNGKYRILLASKGKHTYATAGS